MTHSHASGPRPVLPHVHVLAALGQGPHALTVLDRDLRHLWCSRGWLRDYDLLEEEVLGRLHYEVFPEIPERWREVHRRCLAGAVERAEEDLLRRGDGSEIWLRWEVRPWHDEDGEVGGIVISSEDITSRKRSEISLTEAYEWLQEAHQLARLGRWEWDLETNALRLSPEVLDIFAVSEEHAPATHDAYLALVHPDDRAEVVRRLRAALDGEAEYEVEHRFLHPQTGALKVAASRGRVVPGDDGKPGHLVGTVQDATERRRLEGELEQARRLEAVGQLAGGIAHDFNNLLGVVLGYAELVLDDLPAGHPAMSDVETMRDAAGRARDLTRRLLTFSRRDVSSPRVLDLGERIDGLQGMLRRVLGAAVSVEADLPRGRAVAFVDPTRVDQVFLNLAINARDAMPDGGTLRIGVDSRELSHADLPAGAATHPGRFSVLVVEDTGCGMTPEVVDRIFDPFFTTKGPDQGTGLGLSTVYGIVSQAGGFLRVDSTPGAGTRFEVFLPCVQPSATEGSAPSDAVPAGGAETILVVDDEPEIRAVHARHLSRAGYRVLTASGAGEALLVAEKHPGPIHLLVTDLGMPVMDGIELARRLRATRPYTLAMLVTGSASVSAQARAPDMEGVPILEKPVTKRAFLQVVRETLDACPLRQSGSLPIPGAPLEGRSPTPDPRSEPPHPRG